MVDPQALEGVLERSRLSREVNDRLSGLMGRKPAPNLRVDFARCAEDLALEHHSAIVRTVQAKEFGSAGALLRPLLEASTTAYWFVYAAHCEEVNRLQTAPVDSPLHDIPGLGAMLTALTPVFPPIVRISEGLKAGGTAKWLHKYTHGGTPQLIRRASTRWSCNDVLLTLLRADMFVTLAGMLETVLDPNPPLAEFAFGYRDELYVELQTRFGAEPIEFQAHRLPEAPLLADGCGPPFS